MLSHPATVLFSRSVQVEIGHRPAGAFDPYIRGKKLVEAEPRRVVVELHPDEYRALEAACKGHCITAPEFVRLVALRLARVV
jgi:hypothetical protein